MDNIKLKNRKNKKDDKRRKTYELYGKYSQQSIRITENEKEKTNILIKMINNKEKT